MVELPSLGCLRPGAGATSRSYPSGEPAIHALIIEDEDAIAMVIEEVLRGCGFTSFDVAASLDEAVAAAANRCPELITADVELNHGSGIDAVQAICSSQRMPVIFITSRADAAHSRMPEHQVLAKPFRVSDVQAAVQQAIASWPGSPTPESIR